MAQLSQLDKAIAALEAERDVLNSAIDALKRQQQQATKPARTRKKADPRVVGGINQAVSSESRRIV